MNYYNEHDPKAAAWLRELIARGLVAPGVVDERSIVDVESQDLEGYTQCHFFAGIGVWSYALRCAGWPDDRPVWTGSCPCQPFSSAGKGEGVADDRHLWPAWFRLIRKRRPVVVLGEQVSSKDALAWLDIVCADLEGEGYTVVAIDTCAPSVGAPHIRQRLYLVANSCRVRHPGRASVPGSEGGAALVVDRGDVGGVADTVGDRQSTGGGVESGAVEPWGENGDDVELCGSLGNPLKHGLEGHSGHVDLWGGSGRVGTLEAGPVAAAGPVGGFWAGADWIPCRDGKARPVEPGTSPLVAGAPSRVVRLRGYGNAICAPLAQAFIETYLDLGAEQ